MATTSRGKYDLTEECKKVTGGQLNVETDPVKAADRILTSIESKRKKLGI